MSPIATRQVERLNLENVKLQKQLQLERAHAQRYQHKLEDATTKWGAQVTLLQQYVQKVGWRYVGARGARGRVPAVVTVRQWDSSA